jgi:hypothetical protein
VVCEFYDEEELGYKQLALLEMVEAKYNDSLYDLQRYVTPSLTVSHDL